MSWMPAAFRKSRSAHEPGEVKRDALDVPGKRTLTESVARLARTAEAAPAAGAAEPAAKETPDFDALLEAEAAGDAGGGGPDLGPPSVDGGEGAGGGDGGGAGGDGGDGDDGGGAAGEGGGGAEGAPAEGKAEAGAPSPAKTDSGAEGAADARPGAAGPVARRAADENGVAPGAERDVARAAASDGVPLPQMLARKFQDALGADLAQVRVHDGAESASAAESVGARAYTTGQDIHFAEGQYDPGSSTGETLLAHEVAHTAQQAGQTEPVTQNKMEVSTPDDPAEREADRAAESMVVGRAAEVTSSSGVVRKLMREAAAGGGLDKGALGQKFKIDKELGKPIKIPKVPIEAKVKVGLEVFARIEAESNKKPGGEGGKKEGEGEKKEGEGGHGGGAHPHSETVLEASNVNKKGVEVELKKKYENIFHQKGLSFDVKGGFEVNPKEFKLSAIGCELGKEFEIAKWLKVKPAAGVSFNLIQWPTGKPPEFGVVKIALSVEGEGKDKLEGGKEVLVSVKGEIALELSPDYKEIGKVILEKLGPRLLAKLGPAALAAAPVALAAGAGLAAASAIFGGMALVGNDMHIGKEMNSQAKATFTAAKESVNAYIAGLTGKPMATTSPQALLAHMQGMQERAAMSAELPEGLIDEKIKELYGDSDGVYKVIWKEYWPKFKEGAIQAFKDKVPTASSYDKNKRFGSVLEGQVPREL